MKRFFSYLFIVMIALGPSFAQAGSTEATKPNFPAASINAFADRVQNDLASRGANIAIVARKGRNPSTLPKGIEYTHVAYWVYSEITNADGSTGRGYRVYNLYQTSGDPTRSRLVQDSPADFFTGAFRLDAGVIIPDKRLQQKLLKVVASPAYSTVHNASYSVLSNPENNQFQNCTEHTLNVLMASLYDTDNLPRIKANISAHFDPQPIRLGGLKRTLAPATSKALTTKDHGATVATTTFGALARFMEKNDLAQTTYRITPSNVTRF